MTLPPLASSNIALPQPDMDILAAAPSVQPDVLHGAQRGINPCILPENKIHDLFSALFFVFCPALP
jgi:hypothetical protein